MKKHLLYTALALFSCNPLSLFADENVVSTIKQITETAKNVAGSVKNTTEKISTRTKEEAQYFAQEIRSYFRTPQQILLKQKPEDVAQNHEVVIITATLQRADRLMWSSIVDLCNAESVKSTQDWYCLLETIYLTLRTSLTQKDTLTIVTNFVPKLPVSALLVSHLDDTPDEQSITVSIVLQRSNKLYEWIEPIQQSMNFILDLSYTDDPYHQLDLFYSVVATAIQKNTVKTICIESSNSQNTL